MLLHLFAFLALSPFFGTVVEVGLHLVNAGFQGCSGLLQERVPPGCTGHGWYGGCGRQSLSLHFGQAGLLLAFSVGFLSFGVACVLSGCRHGLSLSDA